MNRSTLRHGLHQDRQSLAEARTARRRPFVVAEADHDGDPSRTVLAVVAVGRSRWLVRETLDRVADAVAAYPRARLLSQAIVEI